VRGRGLFVGIEIVRDRAHGEPDPARAREAQRDLRERGILVGLGGRFGNVLKVSPPLVVDQEELLKSVTTIGEAVR
jgi:4-aminobutyrate aminotransferase-like enzyme